MPQEQTRKFWGWGIEGGGPSAEQAEGVAKLLSAAFGGVALTRRDPPRIEEITLPAPRSPPPSSLAELCSSDPVERAWHSYGKSFRDVVRAFRGDFQRPPDFVARPRSEAEVVSLLDWCSDSRAAAIPYGGGSSVVGGVETSVAGDYAGVVSIDLGRLDRVLEIDRVSRAARIQAGVLGPSLEDQLRPHGLTLRHFPQSFVFSSRGGWIASRAGGPYATLYTHIDDFVESLRTVTPTGVMESRRVPGSGAGVSPDRLVIGSEGILGVIVEAWMRLQDRPGFRASTSVRFEGEEGWVEAADSGKIDSNPKTLTKDFPKQGMSGTDPSKHVREFLDCVKSRKQPAANADVTRYGHIVSHAASIAWRLGRKVQFDPVKETFLDDEEANRMIGRALRAGWTA